MPFLLLSLVVSAVCLTHYLVTPIDPKILALILAGLSALIGFMGLTVASKKAVEDDDMGKLLAAVRASNPV